MDPCAHPVCVATSQALPCAHSPSSPAPPARAGLPPTDDSAPARALAQWNSRRDASWYLRSPRVCGPDLRRDLRHLRIGLVFLALPDEPRREQSVAFVAWDDVNVEVRDALAHA